MSVFRVLHYKVIIAYSLCLIVMCGDTIINHRNVFKLMIMCSFICICELSVFSDKRFL